MTLITPIATICYMKEVKIVLIDYPFASKSAIYGFIEVIEVATSICEELNMHVKLSANSFKLNELSKAQEADIIVIPPCVNDTFYTQGSDILDQYLRKMQRQGATLASACMGSFLLAKVGFLDNKFCTTHWRLAQQFQATFPKVKLNTNAIIINEGNIITAGGRMAWLDLAVEIISFYCSPAIVSALSKEMVIDIGRREQKFYRQFIPKLDHGDELILNVQKYLDEHYSEPTELSLLADKHFVSARTLQRRFQKALKMSVIEYLQRLRLHQATKYIELSSKNIVEISYLVGYQNVNSFRKLFYREYGLTPGEYRKRFKA